jgi:FkbM family methyltransferase
MPVRRRSRTVRRIKKLLWWVHVPAWVDNEGVLLPTEGPGISPGIRRQIFFGEYEDKEIEIVARRLASDDRVMEVGAGIGFLSAYCAKRIGSERVFAYEANPALMELIAATHRANGVAPTVRNLLLGRGEGSREFYVEPEFWASSAVRGSPGARTIRVPQADLNAELRRVRPSFLIVDIEGGEIEFFETADLATVRKICVETHPAIHSSAALSQMLCGLFRQGFALDFALLRKNVFYLSR